MTMFIILVSWFKENNWTDGGSCFWWSSCWSCFWWSCCWSCYCCSCCHSMSCSYLKFGCISFFPSVVDNGEPPVCFWRRALAVFCSSVSVGRPSPGGSRFSVVIKMPVGVRRDIKIHPTLRVVKIRPPFVFDKVVSGSVIDPFRASDFSSDNLDIRTEMRRNRRAWRRFYCCGCWCSRRCNLDWKWISKAELW